MHQWIYNNVRRRWAAVIRRPAKLAAMFSGYKASRRLVTTVLQRSGVPTNDAEPIVRCLCFCMGLPPPQPCLLCRATCLTCTLRHAQIRGWGERELHRLVAIFLQLRFPMLLALNKADHAASRPRIEHILRELPHHRAVPVSALAELTLRSSTPKPAAVEARPCCSRGRIACAQPRHKRSQALSAS